MNPRLNTNATLAFYNSHANEIYNEDKFHMTSASTEMDDLINISILEMIVKNIGENDRNQKLKGKTFLEIGCAKGHFLCKAKEYGASVVGVELNQSNCRIANNLLGGGVFDRDLLELNFPSESFDVIYTLDVIEHIHTPMAFLKEVSRLVRPGGIVFMETHNVDGLIHRLVKGKHTCIFGFEHHVHWSPKTLSLAFKKNGLQTQSVYFESSDFKFIDIIGYFRQSTLTTIFPWRCNRQLDFLLKLLSIPFRMPIIWHLDQMVMPRVANILKAGSTMKVLAIKPLELGNSS